jgi:hypothetical protein
MAATGASDQRCPAQGEVQCPPALGVRKQLQPSRFLRDALPGGEERNDRGMQVGGEPGGEHGGALLIDLLIAGLRPAVDE